MDSDGSPLGNTQVVPEERDFNLEFRWQLRNTLREVSKIPRLRHCGNVLGRAVAVQELATGERALGGLESCSSVWACPVCSAKISAYRQDQLSALIRKANDEKKYVSMMTLTMRHHKGQDLGVLWNALSKAWNFVGACKKFKQAKEQLGIIGSVRGVECTVGDNGFHLHTHILFITDVPITTPIVYQRGQGTRLIPYPEESFTFEELVAERWGKKLAQLGIDFDQRVGIDVRQAKQGTEEILARYVGKVYGNLSAEMTLGAFKKARVKTSRTPFQILADIKAYGDLHDIKLWRIWEKESRGKFQLIWSRGLKDWADIENLLTDEEIINQDSDRETLFFIARKDWKILLESGIGAKLFNITDIIGS